MIRSKFGLFMENLRKNAISLSCVGQVDLVNCFTQHNLLNKNRENLTKHEDYVRYEIS